MHKAVAGRVETKKFLVDSNQTVEVNINSTLYFIIIQIQLPICLRVCITSKLEMRSLVTWQNCMDENESFLCNINDLQKATF